MTRGVKDGLVPPGNLSWLCLSLFLATACPDSFPASTPRTCQGYVQFDRLFYFSKPSMNIIVSLKVEMSSVISAGNAAHLLQKVSSALLQLIF